MAIKVVKFQIPVKCNYCKYEFNNSRALIQHMESDHDTESAFPCMKCPKLFKSEGEALDHFVNQHNIDIAETNSQDKDESSSLNEGHNRKLNYVLNEFKNVKTAKTNAKRKLDLDRKQVDDLNTRYEVNSALFLVFKEEMEILTKGNLYRNNETDILMEAESIAKQLDKKDNNPVTVVKWKISDSTNSWSTKVTMNMYHTNQSIHFQGGERRGNVTSCSLAGDFFESFCKNLIQRKAGRIDEIKDFLLKLDGRKKYGSQPLKKNAKKVDADITFKCDSCHYKTVTKTELKRHLFLTHQKKVHPITMKKVTFKLDKEPVQEEEDVDPDSECLDCYFSCKGESELENHRNLMHKRVAVEKQQDAADKTKLLEELWKENSVLLKAQHEHDIILNTLKQKEQEMIADMTTMKTDIRSLITGKEKAEESYQEATKVIAEQRGRLTEQNETIKVLKSSLELERNDTPAGLRQRKIPSPAPIPPAALPTPAPTLAPVSAPAPSQAPISAPGTVEGGEGRVLTAQDNTPSGSRRNAPAPPANLSADPAVPTQDDEEWRDGWEEVFEDNETGDLVAQQSNRLDHSCKKCDKQLDTERQFRQHMKEHMKKDSQLVKCHYCDFMTNDASQYLNHIGDTHSPKFTCDVCGEHFTEMTKKIEHVMLIHAFTYTTQEEVVLSYKCYDCGEKLANKNDLISHKKSKHFKTKLCSYFHSNSTTCRFPAQKCMNIHNENIQPVDTVSDYRSRIMCKNGNACFFLSQPGGCFLQICHKCGSITEHMAAKKQHKEEHSRTKWYCTTCRKD